MFDQINDLAGDRYVDPAVWALAYLSMKDYQRALDSMTTIIEKPTLVSNLFTFMFIRENAWSDPVLEQPEFLEVRRQLEFRR